MKSKDLLEIKGTEKNKLKTEELKQIVKQLTNVANLRIRRLKEKGYKGIYIPLSYFRIGTTRGANKTQVRNELQSKLTALQSFLNRKTSTIRGAKEFFKKSNQWTYNLNDEEKKIFWESYRFYMDKRGMKEIYASHNGYNPVLEWLSDRMNSKKFSFDYKNIIQALDREEKRFVNPNDKFGKYKFRRTRKK